MDVCELQLIKDEINRHPWEIARYFFVNNLIKGLIPKTNTKIYLLDIGCGDGFMASKLMGNHPFVKYTGIDTALSTDYVQKKREEGVNITNSWDDLFLKKYDLIIMLDVLEHVEDDIDFLKWIKKNLMGEQSYILITVPFHQALYSSHDIFLGHYRRYSYLAFERLSIKAGLKIEQKGQFFSILLLIRFVQKLLISIKSVYCKNQKEHLMGVAGWDGNKILTDVLVGILKFDCSFLSFLPGLSGYIICRKK
jgi:SAM-dependent methyltransferase